MSHHRQRSEFLLPTVHDAIPQLSYQPPKSSQSYRHLRRAGLIDRNERLLNVGEQDELSADRHRMANIRKRFLSRSIQNIEDIQRDLNAKHQEDLTQLERQAKVNLQREKERSQLERLKLQIYNNKTLQKEMVGEHIVWPPSLFERSNILSRSQSNRSPYSSARKSSSIKLTRLIKRINDLETELGSLRNRSNNFTSLHRIEQSLTTQKQQTDQNEQRLRTLDDDIINLRDKITHANDSVINLKHELQQLTDWNQKLAVGQSNTDDQQGHTYQKENAELFQPLFSQLRDDIHNIAWRLSNVFMKIIEVLQLHDTDDSITIPQYTEHLREVRDELTKIRSWLEINGKRSSDPTQLLPSTLLSATRTETLTDHEMDQKDIYNQLNNTRLLPTTELENSLAQVPTIATENSQAGFAEKFSQFHQYIERKNKEVQRLIEIVQELEDMMKNKQKNIDQLAKENALLNDLFVQQNQQHQQRLEDLWKQVNKQKQRLDMIVAANTDEESKREAPFKSQKNQVRVVSTMPFLESLPSLDLLPNAFMRYKSQSNLH